MTWLPVIFMLSNGSKGLEQYICSKKWHFRGVFIGHLKMHTCIIAGWGNTLFWSLRKKQSKPGASGTKQDEGYGSGIMLRDRLRKLMADWGSYPAAPVVYEGMEDERL